MPRICLLQLSTLSIVALTLLLRISSSQACKISEFPCQGGALCLPLDKYCDGRNDCGDASDEPKYCTGNSIYNRFLYVAHIYLASAAAVPAWPHTVPYYCWIIYWLKWAEDQQTFSGNCIGLERIKWVHCPAGAAPASILLLLLV